MSSVFDSIANWARKATTSFAELHLHVSSHEDSHEPGDGKAYQLRHWPDLTPTMRTADVLRALSVMSHRPVNRRWILATTKLKPAQVDSLLQRLVDQGAVTVIDTNQFFAPGASARPAHATALRGF
jgi:hypothetical protein